VQEDGIPLTGELLSGGASDRTWNGNAVGYMSELLGEQGFVSSISVKLKEKNVRGKGRPKKDAPPPATNRTWRVVVEIGEVEEKAWKSAMDRESTFILVYRMEQEGDALRAGGQKLARPTTQTILYHFGTMPLLESVGKRFMPNPPGGNGTRIMDALGFSWELYTHGD